MKEKLTLRNVLIWGAAFLGLLCFFLSFGAKASIKFDAGQGHVGMYIFDGALWGSKTGAIYLDGVPQGSGPIGATVKPAALPLIGLILILVSAISAVLVSLLVKNEKIQKIVMIAVGVLSIVGGVFVFFNGENALRALCYLDDGGLDHIDAIRAELKEIGAKLQPRALAIVIGSGAILAGLAFGVSQFLPNKKLAK